MKYSNKTNVMLRRLVRSAAFTASSVLLAQSTTPATTDEVNNPEPVKLSPFVVSSDFENGYRSAQTMVGSRTSKSLLEIAGSVSIINQQQITDLNAVAVHEVLQFGVAGVTQNQTINDDVNIRGFRTTFSLRDGVTKTSFKRNPMFDVERVEVIKGPGAMLLGNNSFLGGGVNFVTRQPSHRKQSDVSVTLGEDNYIRFAANSTGPLVDGNDFKIDYRLTLGGLYADKEKEIENEDQTFVGGAVTAYFGDKTRVLFNGYFMQDNGYFYWEDFLDYTTTLGTAAAPHTGSLNKYSSKSFSPGRRKDAFWDNQDIFANLTLLNEMTDNANLRLSYFYADIVDDRRLVRGITISPDNRTLLRQDIPFTGRSYGHTLQADFNHKVQHGSFTLDSTLGADGSTQYSRQDQSVNTMPSLDTANPDLAADDIYFAVPTFGAGRPHTSQQITRPESLSYYFQENLGLLKERVMLVGGLRWFHPAGTNKNNLTGAVTDRPSESFKTHKYGIIVRPFPAVSIYYTDSQNVFPQTGRTDRFQRDDQLGPPLSAQEGKMEEYGIKVERRFNPVFSAYGSLTYYDMSLTHVRTAGVLPEGIPPGTIGIIESAADMSQGWELEYGLRFNSGAGELDLMGTYADGESQTAADPNQMAVDFVPRKTSLLARYSWKAGPVSGLMIGATYFDQSAKRNAGYWIDFPATYNLFSRYAWNNRWSVQLNLNNITDERYIVAIAGSGLVQTESGFDAKLAVKYRW